MPDLGVQCPLCNAPLDEAELRAGVTQCRYCRKPFEGTLFTPRELQHDAVAIVTETPDGVAGACANHARNAAVATCRRCGLFICSLCEMNVGQGSYCPACFDRVRSEGTLEGGPTRYRNYAGMAVSAVVLGFLFSTLFLGLPAGIFAIYYAIKGIRQRRDEGVSIAGMIVAIVFAILEIVATLAFIGFLVWGLLQ